jgi:hypothetical protein
VISRRAQNLPGERLRLGLTIGLVINLALANPDKNTLTGRFLTLLQIAPYDACIGNN